MQSDRGLRQRIHHQVKDNGSQGQTNEQTTRSLGKDKGAVFEEGVKPQSVGKRGGRDSKGRFLPGSNPDRSRLGCPNKFTLIKQEIAEVWPEIKGKRRLKDFAKLSNRNFAKFMDWIVTLAKERNNGNKLEADIHFTIEEREKKLEWISHLVGQNN